METVRGKPYSEVFRRIRLQHVIKDLASVGILESDRVIPESELSLPWQEWKIKAWRNIVGQFIVFVLLGWLQPLYRQQWLRMLMVDQRLDEG